MLEISPALYINITEECNLKCEYCSEYGETWKPIGSPAHPELFEEVCRIARSHGLPLFRISGGEPLKSPETTMWLIERANKIGQTAILLSTNGTLLSRSADSLSKLQLSKVKVSLDTVNPKEFASLTGGGRLEDVLTGIAECQRMNVPIEINLVLTKSRSDELWPVLDYCMKSSISIKLLDLVRTISLRRKDIDGLQYWSREYIRPSDILPELEERFGPGEEVCLSGDRGVPMTVYKMSDSSSLIVKDSARGSTFAQACKACSHFPCQEGLFHMSVGSDGRVSPCRLREDLAVDFRPLSCAEREKAFSRLLDFYDRAFFLETTIEFP